MRISVAQDDLCSEEKDMLFLFCEEYTMGEELDCVCVGPACNESCEK